MLVYIFYEIVYFFNSPEISCFPSKKVTFSKIANPKLKSTSRYSIIEIEKDKKVQRMLEQIEGPRKKPTYEVAANFANNLRRHQKTPTKSGIFVSLSDLVGLREKKRRLNLD